MRAIDPYAQVSTMRSWLSLDRGSPRLARPVKGELNADLDIVSNAERICSPNSSVSHGHRAPRSQHHRNE